MNVEFTLGGLWEVSAAVLSHPEADEEGGGAPTPAPAPWQTQPLQIALPCPAPGLRLMEDVSHSVQKTTEVSFHVFIRFVIIQIMFRYSDQVPSYEKSMLEVSRRIRNRSVPPPASSSSSTLRSLSRPPTPTPPSHYCHCGAGARAGAGFYNDNKRSYVANISNSHVYDYKRSTPSRGFWYPETLKSNITDALLISWILNHWWIEFWMYMCKS